jgi:proteic killer suppression protein
MILSFKDKTTEAIFNGSIKKGERKRIPESITSIAARKLDLLDSAKSLEDLRIPSGNRLKALVKVKKGSFSIRINDQYRICFRWSAKGPYDVELVVYH